MCGPRGGGGRRLERNGVSTLIEGAAGPVLGCGEEAVGVKRGLETVEDASVARFVLLEHHWEGVHWDLMLEQEGVLKTWRLPKNPLESPTMVVQRLPDHRLAYLDYEGPVSKNRGYVRRIDRGAYRGQISPESVVVALEGERLRGTVYLTKTGEEEWAFEFRSESARE